MRPFPRLLSLLVGALATAAVACNDTEPTLPDARLAVIRAYLYAGEPVTDVQVTEMLPLGSADSVAPPVNDAKVTLIRRGMRYALVPAPGDSGYYRDAASSLTVASGDTFDLEVVALGRTATARTVIPSSAPAPTLSSDTVAVPTFGGFGPGSAPGTRPDLSQSQIVVRWPNAAGDYYYVAVESTDPGAAPVDTRFRARRAIFPPTQADSFVVRAQQLTYYGTQRAILYHVNREYAALYDSRQQDSRDLNEPSSNIVNGLGVFSGFTSSSARFLATQQ